MTKEEIAQRFPTAVQIAREYREIFGDGVRLLWAKGKGAELGRPISSMPLRAL